MTEEVKAPRKTRKKAVPEPKIHLVRNTGKRTVQLESGRLVADKLGHATPNELLTMKGHITEVND